MVKTLCCIASCAAIYLAFGVYGAQAKPSSVLYQYPIANSVEVQPKTSIGIRANGTYDPSMLYSAYTAIEGSISGKHAVTFDLTKDRQMFIIRPVLPFVYNERVRVVVNALLLGGTSLTDTFNFSTMRRAIPNPTAIFEQDCPQTLRSRAILSAEVENSLPPINITVDNGGARGTIFMANFKLNNVDSASYLLNLDEHGKIIKKKYLFPSHARDFKIQPTGLLTYFDFNALKYYGMDTAWNVKDSFEIGSSFTGDSYQADAHELRVFPDGGYAMLASTRTSLDQSQWAPNIDTFAVIQGSVIQVFDRDKKQIFEWRGIDHFKVADAIHLDLLANVIDFQHSNSLDFDSSGNIVLSSRYLCEVTKIDGKTGDIIWRLGGQHNQFKLIGDSVWFSYQHAPRWLPNGHLTLFDNSNYDSVTGKPGYFNHSRALEYIIDTVAMTATLVWQWHHTPETYSSSMGYVQRLPNGNTLIGWGGNLIDGLTMTEVKPDNTTVFEMSMTDSNVSYRAFKYLSHDTTSNSGIVNSEKETANSLMVNVDPLTNSVSAAITLGHEQSITLTIFDLLGHPVSEAFSSIEPAGSHPVQLPLQNMSSGTYYCSLKMQDGSTIVRPFVITR